MPRENEPDLEDLPAETREGLTFVLVDTIQEVLEHVFDRLARTRSTRRATALRQAASPARLQPPRDGTHLDQHHDRERTSPMANTKVRITDTADPCGRTSTARCTTRSSATT